MTWSTSSTFWSYKDPKMQSLSRWELGRRFHGSRQESSGQRICSWLCLLPYRLRIETRKTRMALPEFWSRKLKAVATISFLQAVSTLTIRTCSMSTLSVRLLWCVPPKTCKEPAAEWHKIRSASVRWSFVLTSLRDTMPKLLLQQLKDALTRCQKANFQLKESTRMRLSLKSLRTSFSHSKAI